MVPSKEKILAPHTQNEELARTQDALKAIGADFAILSSDENVTYVSHYAVPTDFGPASAQRYVAPMAYFAVDAGAPARGESGLIVSDSYAAGATQASALGQVHMYACFVLDYDVSPRANYLDALRKVLRESGIGSTRKTIAIEEKSLPVAAYRLITAEYPNVTLIDAGPALQQARLVKTARELDLLRAAAEVNKAGHTALVEACKRAGQSEFDMWSAVINAMEKRAGGPVIVFGELVTGARCAVVRYPGGPLHVMTHPGNLALMDMSTRVNGYWTDCTNTLVIGDVEPTATQRKYGVAAREAFHAAAEKLRPGNKAHEAFDAAAATFAKHGLTIGHYGGHQIGVTVNEHPRLVPWEQTVIQEGMVFSIEPGSYEGPEGSAGARMEKSVIVHQSGPEILCDFEWGF
jgi:Xaa-Pro aminopeptidase